MQYRKPEQLVSNNVMKKKKSRQNKSVQPDPTKAGTEGRSILHQEKTQLLTRDAVRRESYTSALWPN